MRFLIFILVLFNSCGKDKSVAMHNPSPQMNIKPFIPLKVGNMWTYLYYDISTGYTDTMVISAQSSLVNSNGDTLLLLQRKLKNIAVVDTLYVQVLPTAITYFTDISMRHIFDRYLLPLSFGLSWSDGVYSQDNTSVIGYPGNEAIPISIYGTIYDSLYATLRQATDNSYKLRQQTEIKPGIGIITFTNLEAVNYNYGYDLLLLNYHIVE